ncbi:cobalamin biosynthesis protein [Nocardioides sp. AE5]|uniref:cobalamin biosynthesis protein n=1 Tax=Nocardioides sp. AE5 TaxID=2962573 RepID=UPI002880CE7C|nr:cobalamin biosynthesis protein [Nocardioides sp. AE5]MDT0202204.1 cobalamin biosynthesis protein [Nocardioides sp. AE5]
MVNQRSVSRALGIVLGHAADRCLGDPARFHPVAGFGQVAGALERRTYADTRGRGVAFTVTLVGGTAALGLILERAVRDRPVLHTAATAAATWAVLGGTSLGREATAVHGFLAAGDLPGARQRLTHLVGRDTSQLDESGVARASIESVAENTSDAVTAPLVLGAAFGIPGLVGYRAANTLDAMVGHRTARHEQFGWASARLDDVLNLAGARLAALLAAGLAPTVAGSPRAAMAAWRSDARHHPSPNAGPVEASFAGALGVQLGGVNRYGDRIEDRHTLGTGRPPVADDIDRATTLAARVAGGSVAVAALLALTARRRAG